MKGIECFSVAMGNLSGSTGYVILIMTVEITVRNQGKMELFVVFKLVSFMLLKGIFSLIYYNLLNFIK